MLALIKLLLKKTSLYKKIIIQNKQVMSRADINIFLNTAPPVFLDAPLKLKPRVGIVRTQSSSLVVGYDNPKASWLRYERFCINNDIPYGFFEIKRSDWIERAADYDIIICHTEGTPEYQEMIEDKIYILEKFLDKTCFPSFHEVWQYENKVRSHYLYSVLGLQSIPTWVTFAKDEAKGIHNKTGFPLISKTTIGAGSVGVEKINSNNRLVKIVSEVFSRSGRKTQYPNKRQKDYLYVQQFIEEATFDLRIIIVGTMAFGYYRYPKEGDFKASGSGIYEKKAIPLEALEQAISIKEKLQCRQVGVDLLYSNKKQKYLIIETSIFNQIDTPVQLEVEGVAGYYDISDQNNIVFKVGEFWIQELLMKNLVESWEG